MKTLLKLTLLLGAALAVPACDNGRGDDHNSPNRTTPDRDRGGSPSPQNPSGPNP